GLETSRGACANARSFPSRALSPTRACRDSLQRNQTQTLSQSSGSFPNDSTQTSSPAGLGLQHLQTVATPISISSPCVSFSTEPAHLINGLIRFLRAEGGPAPSPPLGDDL